jgi:N-acetylneuraminate synthase
MAETIIIAEIGTAHGGDLSRARELAAAAAESGADCAKFQYVIADEIVHPNVGTIDLPGGPTSIYERFRELEQSPDFYRELMSICESIGIEFLCTAFGVTSARALREIGVESIKIASPEANHTELLREVASYHLPTVVSTGVSTLSDIEYALSFLGTERTTVLHCVTAYPAPESAYNVGVIPSLARIFGVPVGLSDHSQDPVLVPGLAVAMGAVAVEKHFTLSREGDGLDDAIAMDPTMFTAMAAAIRRVDAIVALDPGSGSERILAEFRAEYGDRRVNDIVGDGVKVVAEAERDNYATTRRSVIATRDIDAGKRIGPGDVAALRAEKNARPGLEPRFIDVVRGARAVRPIPAGQGVGWDDIVDR